MAYTQADLDRIRRAIARGETEVRQGDRMVQFRSVDELLKVKRAIEDELGTTAGGQRRSTSSLVRARKGV
ncbi:hypothetical protein QYH69_29435 [Paraburkholderia sp. SARCC-3016]|uniref:phage head-tail joining protein n=1 Tax=Paraburkholderia sp. SARCC-3016 TaxID=3058611 RepID=UPI0028095B9B|nr:hypothetical protein [Paraburkholderia sp. SARCC-3016]MDQ7981359.1 hypothetical protein [Paraburkholderia sp. SARCC-3016]